MNEELLKALEAAYARGADPEELRVVFEENGQDPKQVDEFYAQKKKDSGVGISELDESDSSFQEGSQISLESIIRPDVLSYTTYKDFAGSIGFQSTHSFPHQEDKSTLLIVDEDPSELSRLWNRSVASGMLANIFADAELVGMAPDWEDVAYYQSIIQRDAPKEEDVLASEHWLGGFLLDVIRVIPESMISMGVAAPVGAPAAAAGAGAGAAAGAVSGPGALLTAGTGAAAGYFGATSLAIEYASSFLASMDEAGVDTTDEQKLREAFQNPEVVSEARGYALKRGIPVGVFDALSGGLAGRFAKGVAAGTRKAIAKEALLQGGLGSAGELSAQIVAGDPLDLRSVALEAFAELGPAAPRIIYAHAKESAKTQGEKDYVTWAAEQDADNIKKTTPIAYAMNNGEVAAVDIELQNLQKELRDKDVPGERKLLKDRINDLRDQKYRLLKQNQSDLLGMSEEALAEVTQTTAEIVANTQRLHEAKDMGEGERALIQGEIDEVGKKLDEVLSQHIVRPEPAEPTAAPTAEEKAAEPTQIQSIIEGRIAEQETVPTSRWAAKLPKTGRRAARSIQAGVKRAQAGFKKSKFLNLYDPYDMSVFKTEMDKMSPAKRREMEKLLIASEANRKMNPEATHFSIGFGRKGYSAAGRNAGIKASEIKSSHGITTKPLKGGMGKQVIVEFTEKPESVTGRGYRGRKTPVGTGYHEVMHQVWASYFDENPIDFNQFRELIVRRMRVSDVHELNTFANNYENRDLGTLRSEEFMTDLGGLLANDRIQFEASFLEEMKAFLNAIVSKITGQKVQIFEDAALARDLARYLEGVAVAMKTGESPRDVKMSERLQTERFKRAKAEPIFEGDEVVGMQAGRNLEGRPDPEVYEKKPDALQRLMAIINPKMDAALKAIEKRLGVERLRTYDRKFLQALEISESMNIQTLWRLGLSLNRLSKATRKMTEQQRQKIHDLTDTALFSESEQERSAAMQALVDIDENIAFEVNILGELRQKQQDFMMNSPAFDVLSQDLRNAIAENSPHYFTRSYRMFTDPKFEASPEMRKAAEKDLIELEIIRQAEDLMESGALDDRIEKWFNDNGREFFPDVVDEYVEYIMGTAKEKGSIYKKISNNVGKTLNALDAASARQAANLEGDPSLGQLRVPTKKFRERKDLPQSLRDYLGEIKDPFIKMSHTVATLTEITSQYYLVDRINEIAQQSGITHLIITKPILRGIEEGSLSSTQMTDLGRQIGVIGPEQSLKDFMGENELDNMEDLRSFLHDEIQKNYTVIDTAKSPMNGKAVRNDFVSQLKLTPMYQSDNKALQMYYDLLLQMRRVRVLDNLPTWRKNIMGGWYFMAANFVFPYNKHRGGVTFIKDLTNRFKALAKGEIDVELQDALKRLGDQGVLGASPSYGMLGDINHSFYKMMQGEDPNTAWKWLPDALKPESLEARRRQLTQFRARQAYNYGFIDDYTKLVIYLTKREVFAKRLETNPDGRSYAELSEAEKQTVDERTAERIKQNVPTMSRIHPAFRSLFRLPMGDFLSFRVEAFRSFFGIYRNALKDIHEGLSNENLTASQRQAYLVDGLGALSTGLAMASMSAGGYSLALGLMLDDEEERELAEDIRGKNYLLPAWMVGSNIVPVSMEANGKVRFVNISSEDPYDEMQGLIYGRDGISRSDALSSIAKDFTDPNLAGRMLFNLVQGKDSYGRNILDSEDVNWFNKWIIGPNLTDWSDAYGSYVFKEVFLPPNINYIAREYRKRLAEAEKNPDIELQPLKTSAQLSSALVFRDYPVDITKQLYYNLEEENFRTKYEDLPDNQKANRKARLDAIREAMAFIYAYDAKFEGVKLSQEAKRIVGRKFSKNKREKQYLLYGIELPE